MKLRVISAIMMALICIPCLVYGGIFIKLLAALVALVSCYEFISIRQKRFNVALYFSMVAFFTAICLLPERHVGIVLIYIIYLFFLAICSEEFSLNDISSIFMMSIIIAFAANAVIRMYEAGHGFEAMMYIIIAAFGCDTSALFFGLAFGKHKLNERVSPKKTWEGSIGGWAVGALLSFVFGYFYLEQFPFYFIIICSICLPIVSQIGDLSFSLIKRNYKAKDFGSFIPGHGGILDRADSLLFSLIFFYSMIGFIL